MNSASPKQAKISSQKELTGYCLLLIHLITRAAPKPLDSSSLLTQNNNGEQEAGGQGREKERPATLRLWGRAKVFPCPSPHLLFPRKLCPVRPARKSLLDDGTEVAGAALLSHVALRTGKAVGHYTVKTLDPLACSGVPFLCISLKHLPGYQASSPSCRIDESFEAVICATFFSFLPFGSKRIAFALRTPCVLVFQNGFVV